MTSVESKNWYDANQRHLSAAVAVVRNILQRHAARSREESAECGSLLPHAEGEKQADSSPLPSMPAPSALGTICRSFGLSPFERDVLLLCAGIELDSSFAALCADAQGDPQHTYPTFSLALAALPEAHWSALNPSAPLRHWRLIEVGQGIAITLSPLRIDERVLHYLTGVQHLDERLAGMVMPILVISSRFSVIGSQLTGTGRESGGLVPSHRALAERLKGAWSQPERLPVIQLCGSEYAGKQAIAAAACADMGLGLSLMPAQVVPTSPAELEALVRLWNREAILSPGALLLDCHDVDMADAARENAIARLICDINGPLIVASRERRSIPGRSMIAIDCAKPTAEEQRVIWQSALEGEDFLDGDVEALVSQFNLSAPVIYSISSQAVALCSANPDVPTQNKDVALCSANPDVPYVNVECGSLLPHAGASSSTPDTSELRELVWDACRAQVRPRLDDLAQRIEPVATWDDLVLPGTQRRILGEIAVHVRNRMKVYETWGFAAKSSRGLGISALFTGASGTGKTMASEVLANELRLDLYRIDLSAVVSKYIGETEKNLRRVFDAAEDGGAILLFDEADALFGKRSEVKDSHDRYANIEISYLLQRMEAYRGLAILTTNMKSALDKAFLRRIRFIVRFPFPDAAQRAEIWRRIFPDDTPTEGLDYVKLARLNVTGGSIRNIAMAAAFLAADTGEPVRMRHLLRAAQVEYSKLEKPIAEAEVRGWV